VTSVELALILRRLLALLAQSLRIELASVQLGVLVRVRRGYLLMESLERLAFIFRLGLLRRLLRLWLYLGLRLRLLELLILTGFGLLLIFQLLLLLVYLEL
jgi:hypothetical protein